MDTQADSLVLPVHLCWRQGVLYGGPWPDDIRLPHGCAFSRARGAPWIEAAGCLHARLRRQLSAHGWPLADEVPAAGPLPLCLPPPALPPALALAFAVYRGSGRRGLVLGAGDGDRTALALAAIAHGRRSAAVLAPTAAGVDGWLAALRPALGGAVGPLHAGSPPPPVAVASVAAFAALAERWGDRFRLLVADGCDRVPPRQLLHGLSCCTATQRLGFVAASSPVLLDLAAGIGPVLHACRAGEVGRHLLHLPLREHERRAFLRGFGRFLSAYDRFAALAPGGRFSDFVRWARRDEQGRPGLLGYHAALAVLRWTRAKAAACQLLLRQHRGERLLFFTADRASAYALCRSCHVLPVTAELPAAVRRQALAAWASGEVPALCGPRLLEEAHGLPPADVGVEVGAAFGQSQLQARLLRVRPGGVFYQLVAAGTLEAAAARRQHDGA